jgi:hypothetical protein
MTLLVSVITHDYIVHASDMRFTQRTASGKNRPTSEFESKVVATQGQWFNALTAFTGLAYFGRHRTGEWLRETLWERKCATLGPFQAQQELTIEASLRWAELRKLGKKFSPSALRCSFITAGWTGTPQGPAAFVSLVSNFQSMGGPARREASENFAMEIGHFAQHELHPKEAKVIMFGSGASVELSRHIRRLVKRKHSRGASMEEVGRLLGAAMIRVSREPSAKKSVGEEAMIAFVPFPGRRMSGGAVDARGKTIRYFNPAIVFEGAVVRESNLFVPRGTSPSSTAPSGDNSQRTVKVEVSWRPDEPEGQK